MLTTIIKEIWGGKSLLRIQTNLKVKNFKLNGEGIDLGAKSSKSSYYRFFDSQEAKLTYTDFFHSGENIIQIDLEKTLPLNNNEYDFVLLIHVLEHIYNYKNLLKETNRILKNEGKFICIVPFLKNIHPNPNDYFRYTAQLLELELKSVGYKNIIIKSLSFGPFTAGLDQFFHKLKLRPLKVVTFLFCYLLDKIVISFNPSNVDEYPLGYFIEATK